MTIERLIPTHHTNETAPHNEELSELAAALAHEVKNPAALALAHVSLLRKRSDLHGIGDTCDHIEEALEKICSLVQEMLFATYGSAPAYEFDLADNLMDMLEAYQAAWPHCSFSLEAPAEGMVCHGEETYVNIIISNLLKNAVEATAGTGCVMINLCPAPGHVTVIIRDTGSGTEILKPHASGLGLAICKWLLNRMGGRLEFNSPANGGCEAKVLLPYT
ncbi:MAG: HAMP domain-containing histidine kinase [Defluviitaleaceae bacterium]|nr:HAMP domain-containing histidine kinase [Defluviitaleaceae bacterium]